VEVGPYRLSNDINKLQLEVAINSAIQRKDHLEEKSDPRYEQRVKKANQVTRTDRFSYWFSKHYMVLFNLLVFLYLGLPFFAPVLEKLGYNTPAKVIYTVYSPLCHQLAFRSYFLFGEQAYYPREIAHVQGAISYEKITGNTEIDLVNARNFIGNGITGYKVALCQRDVAIYGAILLFGILFVVTGKKLKSIPWYMWVLIGLVPIGLDGVSQLPSLTNYFLPSWIPIRESTPFFRTLTGGLFGLSTAWYLYPLIEETMLDTRRIYQKKIALMQSKAMDK
jgi:uncharacterized membrane protein